MADTIDQAVDNALDAGADIEDMNQILSRAGQPTFGKVESTVVDPATFVENPLAEDSSQAVNPVDLSAIVAPPYVDTVKASRAAARAISVGEDPIAVFEQAISGSVDPDTTAVEQARLSGTQAVVEAAERMAAIGEFRPEATQQVMEEDVAALQEPVLGKYLAHVKTMDGGANIPQEVAKNIAAGMFMQDTIASIWEDMSKAGVAGDIAGLVLVPDGAWNASEVLQEFFPDADFMDRYMNSAEGLLRLRTSVHAMPPEQKVAMFQRIKDLYMEADDNQLQQIFGLLEIFDPEEEGFVLSTETGIRVDQLLDKLAVGGGILGGLSRMMRMYKMSNVAKTAAATQDAEVAGQITHAVMQSDEVAKAVGLGKVDAAGGADPHTGTIGSLLDGAPEQYSTVINKKLEDIDTRVAEATRIDQVGVTLTPEEIAVKAEKAILQLERYEGVQNVTYAQDAKGLTMAFDVVGGDGELLTRGKDFHVPFTVNDVTGGFNAKGLTFVGELAKDVASPNFLFGKDRNALVQTFERINYATGKIKQRMNDTLVAATKGLNKDDLATTQNWLRKGDTEGKVFSYHEIVNTAGNSEKVFEAYAATRRIMDQLFRLKNNEQRGKMVAEGMREATVGGTRVIGKQYDDLAQGRAAYIGNDFAGVLVEGSDEVLQNADKFEEFFGKGYSLVRTRLDDEFYKQGEINARWAFVKPTSTRELPLIVFDQKVGYIPRNYADATFFVKQESAVEIAGKATPAKKLTTLRYFDNQKDANRYIDTLEEAALSEGTTFNRDSFKVLADNEIPRDVLDEDYINARGGMYTSKRKTEGSVQYGLPGTEGELQSPLESIQGYFANIGNRLPLSEYRIGIQKRWVEHAKGMGFLASDWTGSFEDAHRALKVTNQSPRAKSFLDQSFEQIQHVSRVPSASEQRWAGNMMDVAKTLEDRGMDTAAKFMYKYKDTSPLDVVKSATFNLMLGTFNASQLLVQAFGATVAMSINPIYAAKGVPRALAYRHLDLIKDPKVRKAAALDTEKRLGKLGEGFAEEYEVWSKSGLFESVLSSNADHQALAKGMPIDAGLIRRLADKSTLFYREGELVNSRISYATAVQRYRDMNPGKPLDATAIADRAEQFRLNMNNANKATVQKNWLRLLTQFQSINARYVEAYTSDVFTKAERARLFFGQTTLFGSAGVPFLENNFGDFMASVGLDAESATTDEIVALRRGFTGWLFSQVLGTESDVSGRVALGNEFLEGIIEGFTEPKQIPALFFGASWTTVDRSAAVLQNLWSSSAAVITADDLSREDLLYASEAVAKAIAELPSSSRNVMKAQYLLDSGIFVNRHGQPIFVEETNLQTEIMQLFGFTATAADDFYKLQNIKRNRQQAIKDNSDLILSLYTKIATGGADDGQKYAFAVRGVLSSVKDPRDQRDILNQVRTKLRLGRDAKAKLVMDVLREHNSQYVSDTALFLPAVQERLNKQGEE